MKKRPAREQVRGTWLERLRQLDRVSFFAFDRESRTPRLTLVDLGIRPSEARRRSSLEIWLYQGQKLQISLVSMRTGAGK